VSEGLPYFPSKNYERKSYFAFLILKRRPEGNNLNSEKKLVW
jgi:hypothetical protein